MAKKVGGRVQALSPLVVDDYQRASVGALGQDLAHCWLREQDRAVDMNRLEFFTRAHIDQAYGVIAADPFCQFWCSNQRLGVLFVACLDVFEDFLRVQTSI